METSKEQESSGGLSRAISQIPEKLLLLILLLTLLDMVLSVFTRYVTGRAIYWAEEVGTIGLVWITMIGAAICVKRNIHFTMPTFIGYFSPRVGFAVNLINQGLIMAFGLLLLVTGIGITIEALSMSTPALEVNLGVIDSAAVVCGALILIYGIGKVMDIIKTGPVSSPEGHS
jgi:TRAP-type C4-dicarboxylate transport system permease small subunit